MNYNKEELAGMQEKLRVLTEGRQWITLAEWLELWHREYVVKVMSKATADAYLRVISDHVPAPVGEIPLKALTPANMETLAALELQAGAARGAVSRYMTILAAALNVACQCSLLAYNPCRTAAVKELRQPKENRICFLEDGQQKHLEWAVRKETPDIGALIVLHTGLRTGELLGLRWKDVDLQKKTLQVRNMLQRGLRIDEGKPEQRNSKKTMVQLLNASMPRQIDMSAMLTAALRSNRRSLSKGKGANDIFVVHAPDAPFTFMEPRRYQEYLRRQGEQLGIENLTCSLLRDTYAVQEIRKGHIAWLAENMGLSMSTALNKYQTFLMESQTETAKEVNMVHLEAEDAQG